MQASLTTWSGHDTFLPHRPTDAPTAELRAVADELALTRQRLAEARAREKAVEHSRRELLAWIGHDLRAPLARLTAIAEGLEDGVIEPAETTRYHRAIRLQAERLAARVDDVFELAAIDAGTLRPSLVSMNLADLISDALAEAQPAAEAKQITLTGDAPRHLAIHADPHLLWRVLDNLVSNALRETPPGGTVEIIARDRVDAVSLEVRDTCGGISQDAVARVFDPGFRVDPPVPRTDAPDSGSRSHADSSTLSEATSPCRTLRSHARSSPCCRRTC